jgi:energy-coupling factor transporter ATP-binding protein EcfA2
MALQFKKATREQSKARVALIGPSGSGKTYTALMIAHVLGKRIGYVDTERGSARKYVGRVDPRSGIVFGFEVLELDSFSPDTYVDALEVAARERFDVLVIDSLSHAWMGKDGALEQVDKIAKRSQSGNSFTAWRDVTPKHNRLVDALSGCPLHLIVTMRSKMEYVLEDVTDEKGRTTKRPRKVGLAPIQREGLEYEFDVVGDIDLDHNWAISKTRCPDFDGAVIERPGVKFAETYRAWLQAGEPPAEKSAATAAPAAQQPPPAPPDVPHFKLPMGNGWLHKPLTEGSLELLQQYWEKIGSMLAKTPREKHASIKAHLDEIAAVISAKESDAAAATFGDDANPEWGLTPPDEPAAEDGPPCNEPPASSTAA